MANDTRKPAAADSTDRLMMPERIGITVPDRMTVYSNPKGVATEQVTSQTTTLAKLAFKCPGCADLTFEATVYAEWPCRYEGGKLVTRREETSLRLSLPKGIKWLGSQATLGAWLDVQLDAYLDWARKGSTDGATVPALRTGRIVDLSGGKIA